MNAATFLRPLVEAFPYKIHTILTDNGVQFADRKTNHLGFEHIFNCVCHEYGIEHRLTIVNHPWTNDQVESTNRTPREATITRYHYASHDQLREHLRTFANAYDFAKRLMALRGMTVFEHINKCWSNEPKRFIKNPAHHFPRLDTQRWLALLSRLGEFPPGNDCFGDLLAMSRP